MWERRLDIGKEGIEIGREREDRYIGGGEENYRKKC